MKEEYSAYLQSLGFTDVLLPRCNEVFWILSDIAGEEILDIFISEYIEDDGTRYYEDFRVFTKTACLVAANFLHEDRFAVWNLIGRYRNVNLRSDNYNYKEATVSSKLVIYCFREGTSADLVMKSSGENCDHLYAIFKKFIKPHLAN